MKYIKTRRQYIRAYLNYFNNYLTMEAFADHYEITIEQAEVVVTVGSKYYAVLQQAYKEDCYAN